MFRQFRITFGSVPDSHTFEDFVENKCITTTPICTKNKKGDLIWTFTLRPKFVTESNKKSSIDITINEDKGFFLEKVTSRVFDLDDQECLVDYIIEDYMEIEPQKFFPKVVIYQYYLAGTPEDCYKKTFRVKNVSINKPIEDSVFDFRIPEHAIVTEHPAIERNGQEFYVSSIWGADNKPLITFDQNDDELEKYLGEQYKAAHKKATLLPTNSFPYWRIICCTIGFVILAILFTFILIGRRNEK
jgi:hypothetical protein